MGKTIRSDEYKKIVEKLRQARMDAGLSQIEAAKLLKKSQSYISKSEAGEQRLDVLELKRFAKIYKKRLDYFI
ncbi:MAG: helix-turn-helix transcriptional regulator [Candidatus Liptonbacteria bacterium]|nr:helix-turn-helix transcriptional regulator [Candidatus Liptonbacteria bacterium]